MRKVLFVTSEAHPLMKTGGLGDVCGSLPLALRTRDLDVRLLLPGYRDTLARAGTLKTVAQLTVPPFATPVTLLEGRLPGSTLRTWLVDFPPAYDRPGNPYQNIHGLDWHDNATRFALLAREPVRPATVFTIHNLAYQGLFPFETLQSLALPADLWALDGVEFHGQMSFIKGGIAFADRVTTVSPTYSQEIQTHEYGHGLDGLLRHRSASLRGILNGIDPKEWNPGRDPHLAAHYSPGRLAGKTTCKAALQLESGLPQQPDLPLAGMVSRLVTQKGVDLLIEALPALVELPLQLVVLGTGDTAIEQTLRDWAERHPDRFAVTIGYDEARAHRIIAGADLFLAPSRFEPCGLTQMYSMRYGTVPVVRRIGGLADTVIDATETTLADDTATGLSFDAPTSASLLHAITRALALFEDRRHWRQVMRAGMRQDFSWQHSAIEYRQLYDELVPPPE